MGKASLLRAQLQVVALALALALHLVRQPQVRLLPKIANELVALAPALPLLKNPKRGKAKTAPATDLPLLKGKERTAVANKVKGPALRDRSM